MKRCPLCQATGISTYYCVRYPVTSSHPIKLTRPQSRECQKLDWNIHRSVSHGEYSSIKKPQNREVTKISQKELRTWAEFHTFIVVRRLGPR